MRGGALPDRARRSSHGPSLVPTAIAFALLLALQAWALHAYRLQHFLDDAAFFFRYAESIAAGQGYRWNATEPPVWGASAPLWPLALAVGVASGLTAEGATHVASWFFTLSAAALMGWVAHRRFGAWGVLALAAIVAASYLWSGYVLSGLETPLTFFVLALVFAAAERPRNGLSIGLAAGLLAVHKIDLIPIAAVLLAGTALWHREHLRSAVLVSAAVAAAWYGFATWHFGSPLPNSFVTKLHAEYGTVPRDWFAYVSLVEGASGLLLALACAGLVAIRRCRLLALVTTSAVLIPLAGYTLHPPPETFTWYTAPLAAGIVLLAACGLGGVLRAIARPAAASWRRMLAAAVLTAAAVALMRLELPRLRLLQLYCRTVEAERVAAGRWIDVHAPPDARVYTGFGNIAYFSRRFVYDASLLNRRPEAGNLLAKHLPEVWVACPYRTGVPPAEFDPNPGYSAVAKFTGVLDAAVEDFYVVVMFRDDLVASPDLARDQHGELRATVGWMLVELRRMRATGQPLPREEGFRNSLSGLLAQARIHFATEELALARSGVTGRDAEAEAELERRTKALEARLATFFEHIERAAAAGEVPAGDLIAELGEWAGAFSEHVLVADALLRAAGD
jgi:hypothetical protein